MPRKEKPLIGVFGVGLAAYWPQFPGLKERLVGYQLKVEQRIREWVRVVSGGLVDDQPKAVQAGEDLRRAGVDLVFCYVGTYATSSEVLPVVQRSKAPVVVLNLQPRAAMDYAHTDTGEWLANCSACCVRKSLVRSSAPASPSAKSRACWSRNPICARPANRPGRKSPSGAQPQGWSTISRSLESDFSAIPTRACWTCTAISPSMRRNWELTSKCSKCAISKSASTRRQKLKLVARTKKPEQIFDISEQPFRPSGPQARRGGHGVVLPGSRRPGPFGGRLQFGRSGLLLPGCGRNRYEQLGARADLRVLAADRARNPLRRRSRSEELPP